MIIKSIAIWLLIVPLAVLNGTLRDKVISPLIGEVCALPLSGVTLCLLIFVVCRFLFPFLPKGTQNDYLMAGLIWMLLTVFFESAMGYFFMHKSLLELVKAYDFTTGNLWLFVTLFTGIAPWLTGKLSHLFVASR